MRITALLKCTLAATALYWGQGATLANAAAGDPPASVIATFAAPGETTSIENGPAGFQVVIFFNTGGMEVSRIESGTPNTATPPPTPMPPTGTNGQAATDQTRAAAENFLPGLNGNADLTDVFGIPLFPGAEPVDGAFPQLIENNDQQQGNIQIGAIGGEKKPCDKEELADLQAQLAAVEARRARIVAQGQTAISQDIGIDTIEDLRATAKNFLEAANQGPLVIPGFDQLAVQAVLNALNNIDGGAAQEFKELGEKSEPLENALTAAENNVASIKQSMEDRKQRIAELKFELDRLPDDAPGFDVLQIDIQSLGDEQKLAKADLNKAEKKKQEEQVKFDAVNQPLEKLKKQIDFERFQIAVEDAKRRAIAQFGTALDETNSRITDLEDQITLLKILCEGEQSSAFQPSQSEEPPIAVAATQTAANGGELSFSISTRGTDTGLDPRLNLFLKGSLTFNDDDRTGVGQDGETYALAGGVSWLLNPDTNVGLVARYGHSDLSGSSGSTVADTYSIGAFVQNRLSENLFLDLVGSYTHSDISSVFIQPGGTTTGSPEITSFAAQAKISGRVETDNFTITPSFGASYTHVNQHAFTLSDGTLAPGNVSDRLSLLGGATFTKTIRDEADGQTITPNFGLTLFANLTDTDSFLLPNGTRSGAGTFGATATAGVSVQTDAGTSFNFSGSVTSFEKGQNSYGLSLSATIPLN